MFFVDGEGEIFEELIHPAEREAPTGIRSSVPGQRLSDAKHSFAVGAEQLLRELIALVAAVAFEFPSEGRTHPCSNAWTAKIPSKQVRLFAAPVAGGAARCFRDIARRLVLRR